MTPSFWDYVAAIAVGCGLSIWASTDHGDDGVDVPLHRLHERRAWASRIDPGVALAVELAGRSC